jgi:hypothetical protein
MNMTLKPVSKLRILIAGCAIAMGIGASSAALAEPKNCHDTCQTLCDISETICFWCKFGCTH